MRVTTTSMFSQFQTNLNEISSRQARTNIQSFTGKRIVDLSDDPKAISNIQTFTESINRNENYKNSIQEVLDEHTSAEGALTTFADTADQLRQLGIDALQISNQDKLPTLGEKAMKLLTTMVDMANHQYNGVYLFAGTKTTASSLNPTPPETLRLPFELVKETPTSSNPSGLRVTFKGNNEERRINVGPNTTERVSTTAKEAFGNNGTQIFNEAIELYNRLMFKQDGSPRLTQQDAATKDDRDAIAGITQRITSSMEVVNGATGRMAARTQRMESIMFQIDEDNLRLKDFRSQDEDTNVAESIMQLQKDELAMNYSLKVGSKLLSQSLLDFLR